jgi:hypothetical protein
VLLDRCGVAPLWNTRSVRGNGEENRAELGHRRNGLSLRWPDDHHPKLHSRDLSILIVNESDTEWTPTEGDNFYATGLLLPPGNETIGASSFSYAYIGGAAPGKPLRPGEYVRVPVHLPQEDWDAAGPGIHKVHAVLVSLDVRTSEPALLERTAPTVDPQAIDRARIPLGSDAAVRGDRLPFDRLLQEEESSSILGEVLHMCVASAFHATSISQISGQLTARHLEIDKSVKRWYLYDPKTQEASGYRDHVITASHNEFPPRSEFGRFVPDAGLRLAFPEKLSVWGREHDDHRPILIQRLGRHSVLITLEHTFDAAHRGTIVFNTEYGLIEKLFMPTSATVLRNIRVGLAVTEEKPTDLGKLGYVTPAY